MQKFRELFMNNNSSSTQHFLFFLWFCLTPHGAWYGIIRWCPDGDSMMVLKFQDDRHTMNSAKFAKAAISVEFP